MGHNVMHMKIRLLFYIQKMDIDTLDFTSTLSTIKPSNTAANPSDSMTINIKCIISWSTEEKEEVCKKKEEKGERETMYWINLWK